MKIKICGLNPTRDIQLCIDLKVDYLGFVFYEKSPRNVNISDIKLLSRYDKKNSAFVAVTVNPSDEFIKKNIIGNFDFIQLHGSENKNRVADIKNMGLNVIKTIKVEEEKDIDKYKEFDNADIILFDTPGMEKSLEFPKKLIAKLPMNDECALAGSVSVDNIENLSNLGVNFLDLSSSLEGQLGFKDHQKVRNFVKKINDLKN
jgi:phosphoribosylanthranilate isomerase